ncbi:MAG: PH domain-containing protein [Actinobacteria bacterium]|nr:PH domain-containing protein [Actinomycetota bacterium]MBU1944579.1 PH domain-containing protein [Actinomycetota bacterium]MBU2689132.1 PH domain-containing protein [Actinomycetota bacterium]
MKHSMPALGESEEIVFETRHHPWVLVPSGVVATFSLAGWIILMIGFGAQKWLVIVGLVVVLGTWLFFLWRVLERMRTSLVLTNRRLIYQSGLLRRHSREVPVSSIQNVASYQLVLGRLLRMGDLLVQDSQGSVRQAFFDVPHPDRLRADILEQAHPAGTGSPVLDADELALKTAREINKVQPTSEMAPLPPERPPIYSEIVDQIERLDAMRGRGVLTEEEFEIAKRALIDRIGEGSEE